MEMITQLVQLFQDYIAFAGTLRKETASAMAVLGVRDREIYHPGHKTFYDAVGEWADVFVREDVSQEDLMKALEIMLFTAPDYEGKAQYGYLVAVQRHATVLIPLLSQENKTVLRDRFETCYPRNTQLPVQKEVYKLLQKGTSAKKRGFFPFL